MLCAGIAWKEADRWPVASHYVGRLRGGFGNVIILPGPLEDKLATLDDLDKLKWEVDCPDGCEVRVPSNRWYIESIKNC